MFRDVADKLVVYLLRKGILKEDNKEIYVYAFEVILMNSLLLFMLLVLSIIFDCLVLFGCYFSIFIPLRIFSGGYHAKKSEICFCI